MTTHDGPHVPGTPCWADLTVSDLARSQEFYSKLFGWTYGETSAEVNYYTNALVDGRAVAGMGPDMEGFDSPNIWTIYLATDDVAATHEKMTANGATTILEPLDVMDFGRMGLWSDPTGAFVGAWQSGSHNGYELTDAPGAATWSDMMSTDFDRAKDFYAKVFDYTYQPMEFGNDPYALIRVGEGDAQENFVGGMGALPSDGKYPSHWSLAFWVENVDEAVDQVAALGGKVIESPWEFQFGRVAIVSGPDGEMFSLFQPGEDSEE